MSTKFFSKVEFDLLVNYASLDCIICGTSGPAVPVRPPPFDVVMCPDVFPRVNNYDENKLTEVIFCNLIVNWFAYECLVGLCLFLLLHAYS